MVLGWCVKPHLNEKLSLHGEVAGLVHLLFQGKHHRR